MIVNKTLPAINEIADTRVTEKGLSFSPPVSAVIITYNEEHNIRRTLSQLSWCAEIVIVDSFSTDNTLAICKEFGCRIFSKKFEGFGDQKRYAVSKSSHDWVLCIDADEVLTDELVTEIKKSLTHDEGFSGFLFRMNLVFLNKEFLHGNESGRYFLRLFNKRKGGFSEDKVHESITVSGPVKKLDHTIRHYSYHSLHQYMQKINCYTTYSAEIAFNKGKTKSLLAVLFGLPFNFFKYYLLELNCFNGSKGFYWSVFSAYYHFAKYVKLKELHASLKVR